MAGTYTNLLYHIVFSTHGRMPSISTALETELHRYIGGIIRGEDGLLLEIGGVKDHLHLLVKLKPAQSVSEMLKVIKAKSSKWVNSQKTKPSKFAWQDGYAAFSVSESQVPSVRRYIQNQAKHHARLSFQDEFRALLKKHRVECDERYMWG